MVWLCVSPAAVIGFEETEYTVAENGGSVSVVVSLLDGQLSDDVTVVFTTEDGTATRTCEASIFHFYVHFLVQCAVCEKILQSNDFLAAVPTDYIGTTRTLIFGPTRTRQTIAVPISNDQILEDTENFFANLELREANDLDVSVDPSRSEISITDDGDGELKN